MESKISAEEILKEEYEKVFGFQKYENSANKEMNKSYIIPAMRRYASQFIAFEWLRNIKGYKAALTNRQQGWSDEKLLLSFCHFLCERGYKISGYDDSQLLTIIDLHKQYKTQKGE